MTRAGGAPRFELISKLGEGGMGVVYEAFDRERNMRVALKTLRRMDASSLYQLKREFRALSDLSHPSIIALYELVSEGDDWFLSMELVEGEDLITHVRGGGARFGPAGLRRRLASTPGEVSPAEISPEAISPGEISPGAISPAEISPGEVVVTLDTRVVKTVPRSADEPGLRYMQSVPREPLPLAEVVDLDRLLDVLSQLAQALCALHSQGMVHRDLKPGNVCVTREGRVVLMDFGIVAETAAEIIGGAIEPPQGTPAYMAPEQATDAPPSAAADWYAFGVLLYQALTGRLPFRGPGDALLDAKQRYDPVSPGLYTQGIPEDLEALCMELLARDPVARPHGYDVLARLGVTAESISRLISEVTFIGPSEFVGRSQHLQALEAAYHQAMGGTTVVAIAEGVSGMGKSTLLRRFIYEIQATQLGAAAPLILSGRCHARESLSYKAFDGVIDQLSRELLDLPEHDVKSLMPADIDLLTRLFPVLRRIPGVQVSRALPGGDLGDLRARATDAFRALIASLAAWRPVIMRIEDLQWTDTDSVDLLRELLRPPVPARLLILGSLRTDSGAEPTQAVPALRGLLRRLSGDVACHFLEVGPLSRTERELLVAKLVGERNLPADVDDAFWAEADGNPLLLTELARYAAEAPEAIRLARTSLEHVIALRIARLSPDARGLLEIIAVAGEPTPLWLLAEAAGLGDDEAERASATLRVTKLARVTVPGHEPWLSVQHDKIRETVLDGLAPSRLRALHRGLAQALERWDGTTVTSLAHHWMAASEPERAASYLVASARAAVEKLAFDRGAELYRAAAELVGEDARERLGLVVALAETLALAGRHHEAADAYTEASRLAEGDQAVELDRRGADNLLRCGRVREATERLAKLMKHLGVTSAPSRRRKLMALVLQRAQLAVRRIKYTTRTESEVAARDLGRLDTLYAAATALGVLDHLLGAVVQARHLRLALQVGEERRVVRALATEVGFLGALGGKHARRARQLAVEVTARAHALGDPHLIATAYLGMGMAELFGHRMASAERAFAGAVAALDGVGGAGWERVTLHFFLCIALLHQGEWQRAVEALGRVIERAERNRDLYAIGLLKSEPSVWRWLIADQPAEAHRSIDEAIAGWPPQPYYLAHYQAALSRGLVSLYEGDGDAAARVLEQALGQMDDLMLSEMPFMVSEILSYRGRAALLMKDRATAQRCVRRLMRVDAPMAPALAMVIDAALAVDAGDLPSAEELVSKAMRAFEEHGARHMVAACRYRLGQLVGGAQGEELRGEAQRWAQEQGVASPRRMMALLTWRVA